MLSNYTKIAKKGALSINIIVVAAIAMVILVIMVFLIFQTGGDLQEGTSCEALQGVCLDAGAYQDCGEYTQEQDGTWISDSTGRCGTNQFCCKPLGVQQR